MIFSNEILVRAIIVLLGVVGFLVAKHIRNHKTKDAPLVCMVGFDCHAVVHSDYSKFMGMPVELLGMAYYIFISLSFLLFIFVPSVMPIALGAPLIPLVVSLFIKTIPIIALVGFLFSVYLISIQIFVIKKGCSWCIISSLVSTAIFLLIFLH